MSSAFGEVVSKATSSDAQAIAKEVSKFDPDGDTIVAQLGPVVGNYVGPGTLGLAMIKAKPS